MAKKDKEKPEAEADGENAEAKAKARLRPRKASSDFLTKKILMIAVPALVLVLGGGGAGAYFLSPQAARREQGQGATDAPPLTPPQVAFSDVPDILVNIQSSDGTPAYLKLSLSLEMDNDLEKTGMHGADAAPGGPVPVLSARIARRRPQRLGRRAAPEGRIAAPGQCRRRALQVRDVLLKQMIVQ